LPSQAITSAEGAYGKGGSETHPARPDRLRKFIWIKS
jgi:hypothetical protein